MCSVSVETAPIRFVLYLRVYTRQRRPEFLPETLPASPETPLAAREGARVKARRLLSVSAQAFSFSFPVLRTSARGKFLTSTTLFPRKAGKESLSARGTLRLAAETFFLQNSPSRFCAAHFAEGGNSVSVAQNGDGDSRKMAHLSAKTLVHLRLR